MKNREMVERLNARFHRTGPVGEGIRERVVRDH